MKYEGIWHIIEMDMWDEDYCNMEIKAFIRVGSNGIGNFQFGLVSGGIDGEVIKTGNVERFDPHSAPRNQALRELLPSLGS